MHKTFTCIFPPWLNSFSERENAVCYTASSWTKEKQSLNCGALGTRIWCNSLSSQCSLSGRQTQWRHEFLRISYIIQHVTGFSQLTSDEFAFSFRVSLAFKQKPLQMEWVCQYNLYHICICAYIHIHKTHTTWGSLSLMTTDCDSRRIHFPALPLNSSMSWTCDACSISVSHALM